MTPLAKSPDIDLEIKRLYTTHSAKEIADILKQQNIAVSTGTILRRLYLMGVKIRPRGGANHKRRYLEILCDTDPDQVRGVLVDNATTLKEKAALLKVTPATLRAYLKNATTIVPEEVTSAKSKSRSKKVQK